MAERLDRCPFCSRRSAVCLAGGRRVAGRRDNLAFVGFGEDGLGLPPARSGVVTPVTAHIVPGGDIWHLVLDT